jgi:hypothetical protein
MIHALRYTEDLEKSGFTPEQAKKSVIIWMELMDQNFATKSDYREQGLKNEMALAAVRSELKQDISDLRSELKQDISDVRTDIINLRSEVKKLGPDLTIKLGVMMVATVGAISTIISLIR